MAFESSMQAQEVAASRCLGRLLAYRFEAVHPDDHAAVDRVLASRSVIEADFTSLLEALARAAVLLDGAELREEADVESLEMHRVQLGELRTRRVRVEQAYHSLLCTVREEHALREGDGGAGLVRHAGVDGREEVEQEAVAGSREGAARPLAGSREGIALRRVQQPRAPPPAPASLARTSAAATAAALRRTRAAMESELARLGELAGVLDADGRRLGQAAGEHVSYAGDVADARSRARDIAQRQRSDRRAMLLALALLACCAAYIAARRLLWTFLGVRLP